MAQDSVQNRRLRSFGRRWKHALLGSGAIALATVGWAYEGEPVPAASSSSATLNGILPNQVPFGVTSDDFSRLTGNWEAWAGDAAVAVEQLFRDHDSLDSLEADFAGVETRLATMKKALSDSRYRSIHGLLADLYGSLRRRVDVARAILDTQLQDVAATHEARLHDSFNGLKSALADLKQALSRFPNGDHWLPFVSADQLESMANSGQAAPDLLNEIKTRLAGRSTLADEAQREFLSRDEFIGLERAIDGVLDASVTRDQATYVADLQKIGAALFQGIENYEAQGDEISAKAIREQYQAWRATAADGGDRLSDVMREHYLNYNFRTVASEGFMQRLFETRRQESSWVNDRVMEARISGYQCTNTHVNVDIRPSSRTAEFSLNLDGTVQSNTQGFTDQATIHTVGHHTFRAEKEVFFDGHQFSSTPAEMWVNVNNQTLDAQTNIRIPIIRGIANGIAMKEVEKRRPQTDALTRQKIASQVAPRLDSEVDSQFDQASTKLESKVYGPLRELESYPQDLAFSSTDDAILVRARLMEPGELGGDDWPDVAMPSDGLVIQIHESLMNNSMERAGFNGREMTKDDLQNELRSRIEKLLGRKLDEQTTEVEPQPEVADAEAAGDEAANKDAVFLFDTHDAIRFNISNGEVRLIMRTGLRRGDEVIPVQLIEVPMGFTVEGDKILVAQKGTPAVRPVEQVTNRLEQITRANVMRTNIQRLLPDREMKRTMVVKLDKKEVSIKVSEITPRDGWISITAR